MMIIKVMATQLKSYGIIIIGELIYDILNFIKAIKIGQSGFCQNCSFPSFG